VIRLLAAAAIIVMAAGCGPTERPDGPVRFGAMKGTMCLSAASSKDFLFGTNIVTNTNGAGVDITSVRIDGAKNLTYVGAFDTPISGNEIFPNTTEWPVDLRHFDPLVKPDWAHRETAVGPSRLSGKTTIGWNFVLHLKTTSSRASLNDFTVHYTSDGQRYSATSGIALIVRPRC
jgi:hypothetical protein